MLNFNQRKETKGIELIRKIFASENEEIWLAKSEFLKSPILLKIHQFPNEIIQSFSSFLREYLLMKFLETNEEFSRFFKLRDIFSRKTDKIRIFAIFDYGIGNLSEILVLRKSYSDNEIAYILYELTLELISLKKSGVSQGNISPENVVFSLENGEFHYNLIDFSKGFSKELENSPFFEKNTTIIYNEEDFERKDIKLLGFLGLKLMG